MGSDRKLDYQGGVQVLRKQLNQRRRRRVRRGGFNCLVADILGIYIINTQGRSSLDMASGFGCEQQLYVHDKGKVNISFPLTFWGVFCEERTVPRRRY